MQFMFDKGANAPSMTNEELIRLIRTKFGGKSKSEFSDSHEADGIHLEAGEFHTIVLTMSHILV